MKPGPKPKPPAVKKAQGSFQPSRGGDLVEISTLSDLPERPDWLTTAGEEVWIDDITRVTAGSLVTARDSTVFATYCNLMGAIIETWRSGEVPPAAHLSEARKMAEQFGIFGRKSRLIADAGAAPTNPFARNGFQARK
nr:hypothetical protein [Brevundimonas diminuta]